MIGASKYRGGRRALGETLKRRIVSTSGRCDFFGVCGWGIRGRGRGVELLTARTCTGDAGIRVVWGKVVVQT